MGNITSKTQGKNPLIIKKKAEYIGRPHGKTLSRNFESEKNPNYVGTKLGKKPMKIESTSIA